MKPMVRVNSKSLTMLFVGVLVLCGICTKARAQIDQPKITININVAKEVKQFKDNKWIVQHVPAATTHRNDTLVYIITYINEGGGAATDPVIVDPIPEGTVYVIDSAEGKGAEITFSVDGGHVYQPPPAKYFVRKPDGTMEDKIAPADMYTHIRWTIRRPVLPGQSGQLSFKVIIK